MNYSILKNLQKITESIKRKARWIMKLQQYNFTIEYRFRKKNQNADAIELPVQYRSGIAFT